MVNEETKPTVKEKKQKILILAFYGSVYKEDLRRYVFETSKIFIRWRYSDMKQWSNNTANLTIEQFEKYIGKAQKKKLDDLFKEHPGQHMEFLKYFTLEQRKELKLIRNGFKGNEPEQATTERAPAADNSGPSTTG